ncbi:MAG TPA: hypothetical protein VJ623_04280 [Holophagaceae bacterium]|nr:hypothetical protein [Holophagaceae bacterium]
MRPTALRSLPPALLLLAACGTQVRDHPGAGRPSALQAGECGLALDVGSRPSRVVLRVTFKPGPAQGGLVLTLKADPAHFTWEPLQEHHPGYTVVAVSGAGPGELHLGLFVSDPARMPLSREEAVCWVACQVKEAGAFTGDSPFPLEVLRAKVLQEGSRPGEMHELKDARVVVGLLQL